MEEVIERIRKNLLYNKYFNVQMDIQGKKKNGEFLLRFEELVIEFCDGDPYERGLVRIDALGGSGESAYRRYPIDKKLSDVVHMSHTGIACGIKIVLNPITTLHEWDRWEDGYIEGFIRMDSDEETRKSTGQDEWFFWGYLPVSYLERLLGGFEYRDLTQYRV
jgi:hypothetical protein